MPELTIKNAISPDNIGFIVYNLVFSQYREVFTISDILSDASDHGIKLDEMQLVHAIDELEINQMVYSVFGGYKPRYN